MSHTRVRARRGRKTHATSEGAGSVNKTFCHKNCGGWAITDAILDCIKCLQAIATREKP